MNCLFPSDRLVSDTFKVDVPDELPEILLSSGKSRSYANKKVIEIDNKKLNKIIEKR